MKSQMLSAGEHRAASTNQFKKEEAMNMESQERSVKSPGRVDFTRVFVLEGVRRYSLPFGTAGKSSSLKKAVQERRFEKARVLVVQDAMLLSPPEYIFGVVPGDCMSIQTILSHANEDLTSNIDFLVAENDFSLIVIAAPLGDRKKSVRLVHRIARRIGRSCLKVRQGLSQGNIEIDTCLVDEQRRQVLFV